jgi:hypothetical protein
VPEEKLRAEFEAWLEDLGPGDLQRDLATELEHFRALLTDADQQLEEHLRYLQMMGARRVELPSEAYFASARQQIEARVRVRPVSVWARLRAALLPETLLRPLPRVLAGSMIVAAVALLLLLQPLGDQSPLSGQQRYLELLERFDFEDELLSRAPLATLIRTDELQMLFRSAAMLTSPSSLSRSWSLGLGQR